MLFSGLLFCIICAPAKGFTNPFQWDYSSNKNPVVRGHTPGPFSWSSLSSRSSSNDETPPQRPTPDAESDILQSILDSNQKTTYHTLSDIRSYRSWDFSWPTVTKPQRFSERHTYASDKAFFETIAAHNKGLSFDLITAVGAFDEVNSVVLHGGALVDIITKRESFIHDWDFALVGQEYVDSPDKCQEAAKQFVRNVFTYLKHENDRIQIANQEHKRKGRGEVPLFDIQGVKLRRCSSTITIIIPARSYHSAETILQFTFSPHASVEDLLAACTPHCTRLAIKENAVFLDAAAKYCLESLCVVLDEDSFKTVGSKGGSVSHEIRRNIRHFNEKGFDIILPNLDMSKLPLRNLKFGENEVLDLPEMNVIYDNVEENKIMGWHVAASPTHQNGHNSPAVSKGYDASTGAVNHAELIHHNIRCLVADVYDQFQYWAEGEVMEPIFDFAPLLTDRMVDKAYELVKAKYLTESSLNINKVQRYFSATPPSEVMEQILVAPLRDAAEDQETSESGFQEFLRLDEGSLDALIEKEKSVLRKKLSTIRSVLKDNGLDSIVEETYSKADASSKSSRDEILNSIYGDYLKVD